MQANIFISCSMALGIILSGSISFSLFLLTEEMQMQLAFYRIDAPLLSPNSLFLKLMFSTPGSLWDAGVIIVSFA